MTLAQAIAYAESHVKAKVRDTLYVVYSKDEEDKPGNSYHVATEVDLDTYYAGCRIEAVVDEGGTLDGGITR